MMLDRGADALEAFEKALQLDPMDYFAHNGKALALVSLHRYEEALAAIDQAILLAPNDESMYRNKAGILGNLHRHDEAQYYSHNAKKLARSRMN